MKKNTLKHQQHRRLKQGLLLGGLLTSTLLTGTLFSGALLADALNAGVWVIKSGDSLYKIARVIFPESPQKQAQLRKALVTQNPDVFKNGANNISVGDKLQLPAFAIQSEEPVKAVVVAPIIKPVAAESAPIKADTIAPALTKPAVATKTRAPATAPVTETVTETTLTSTPDPQDIIGKVVINVGSLSAENRGATRRLNRRSAIYRGDTLSTGERSVTQIRLKDGALLSLRPRTHIRIAQYHYNGQQDGTEKSIIELLKGGFRTVTGAIGHLNKQNYQVKTSMATIGIRGTHYSLVLCQQASCDGGGETVDDGLYGGVADGRIVIKNQTGLHSFSKDQFFHLASASAMPAETLLPPPVLRIGAGKALAKHAKNKADGNSPSNKKSKSAPRRLAIIFEANQPNPDKKPSRLPKDTDNPLTDIPLSKAPNGSAALISFTELDQFDTISGTVAPVIISPANDNRITLASERRVVEITEQTTDLETGDLIVNQFIAASPTGGAATLVPSSVGGDPNLRVNWGRWNGDFTILDNGKRVNTGADFHFIYSDNLTSTTQLANLGGLKGRFVNYAAIDGTLPTDNLGNVGTNLATISMDADFISQEITGYTVSATIATDAGDVFYQAGIISPIPFASLSSSFYIDGSGCAGGTCTGEANVLFIGPEATGAISSYQIKDFQSATSVSGTALLVEIPPQF